MKTKYEFLCWIDGYYYFNAFEPGRAFIHRIRVIDFWGKR